MASKLDGLDPEARRLLGIALAELQKAGVRATISSGYRSPEKQQELWANRFTNPYPVAPPGRSKHEHGTAVDLVLADEKQRKKANQILSQHGWIWPLGEKDRVHYEFDPGQSPTSLTSGRVTPPRPSIADLAAAPPKRRSIAELAAERPSIESLAAGGKRPSIADLVAQKPAARGRLGQAVPTGFYGGEQVQTAPTPEPRHVRVQPGRLPTDPVRIGDIPQGTPLPEPKWEGTGRVIRQTAAGIGQGIVKATATLQAVPGAVMAVQREVAAERKKYGGKAPPLKAEWQAVGRGLKKAAPAALKAVETAWVEGRPVDVTLFSDLRKDPVYAPIANRLGWLPEILDFGLSMRMDAISGRAQGAVGKAIGKGVSAADRALGVSQAVQQKVPAIARHVEQSEGWQKAVALMSRSHAKVGNEVLPHLDDYHQDVEKTSRKLSKKTQLRTTDPVTGKPVNELTRLAADYMDAGARGSRHERIHPPIPKEPGLAEAEALVESARGKLPRAVGAAQAVKQAEINRAAAKAGAATEARFSKSAARFEKQQAKEAAAKLKEAQRRQESTDRALAIVRQTGEGRAVAEFQKIQQAERVVQGLQWGEDVPRTKAAVQKLLEDAKVTAQREADEAAAQLAEAEANAAAQAAIAQAEETARTAASEATMLRLGSAGRQRIEDLASGRVMSDAAERAWERSHRQQALAPIRERAAGTVPKILKDAQQQRRAAEMAEIRKEAEALGIPWEDVERLGQKGQMLTDKVGNLLVEMKLLDKKAFERMRGSYLPRSYLLTSGNLWEREAFLNRLEKIGALTGDALRKKREEAGVLGRREGGTRIQPEDFRDRRVIEEFESRIDPTQARAAVPEATPAVTSYTQRGVSAVAEAQGHAAITDPKLGLAVQVGSQTPAPSHWPEMTLNGVKYAVNPGTYKYLNMKNDPAMLIGWLRKNGYWKGAERLQKWTSLTRRLWVSSPKTAVNNTAGNFVLGESAAAMNGVPYTPQGAIKAWHEYRRHRKGGKATRELEMALPTGILGEGAMMAPSGARSFSGGFGVESLGKKALQAPGKAFDTISTNMYEDMEKASRYYLFKQLVRGGKSADEAADIVNRAMITYTDVGPLIAQLEKHNIAPFITFPSKAIFEYMRTAALRPDRFYTYTGERLRQTMDRLADEEAKLLGKEGREREKRRLGELSPFEIPLAGRFDETGKQVRMSGSLLAPMFGGLFQNKASEGPSSLVGGVLGAAQERVVNAVPFLNLARDVLTNQQTFNEMPIVQPGSIPGTSGGLSDAFTNLDVAKRYGSHIVGAFLPQWRDINRVWASVHGGLAYEAQGAPGLRWKSSFMKALTGVKIEPGIGENKIEKDFRKATRIEKTGGIESEYATFADEYAADLQGKMEDDPTFIVDQDLYAKARGYPEQTLNETLKGAGEAARALIYHDQGTGMERKKRIRRMIDWNFALAQALLSLKRQQAQSLSLEQQEMVEDALGGLTPAP